MAIANGQGTSGDDAGGHPYVPGHDPHFAGMDAPRDDAPFETGRLEFGDDDVRLPWLESDGDDDDQYQSRNTGQLAVLTILGVLALALIGGGTWWVLGHGKEDAQIADGSIIAAPRQPYKERPKDPGGKTFAGTGDTSFAVSEGQTRPARLGDSPVPKSLETLPSAGAGAGPGSAPAEPVASGVGVQVAAYSNRAQAEAGWTRLSGQYEVLSGLKHRVVEGTADIGTVYRLQVLAGDLAGANALCGKLKAAGLACQVKH